MHSLFSRHSNASTTMEWSMVSVSELLSAMGGYAGTILVFPMFFYAIFNCLSALSARIAIHYWPSWAVPD